jgi:hypothetical protein
VSLFSRELFYAPRIAARTRDYDEEHEEENF